MGAEAIVPSFGVLLEVTKLICVRTMTTEKIEIVDIRYQCFPFVWELRISTL